MEWFGESTVSLVGKAYIQPIKDGVQKKLKQKSVPPDLKEAILEAIQEASRKKAKKK